MLPIAGGVPASGQSDGANAPAERVGDGRGGIRLAKVGNFAQPVHVNGPPGAGKVVFVVEKAGRVRVVRNGEELGRSFLDIRGKVSDDGERGLLSIAFPNYRKSRVFYVFYTDNRGDLRVVKYKRKGLKAVPKSAQSVIRVGHRQASNHNGGQIAFGPDGFLYISTGDGGGAGDPENDAQDKSSLLGKILRIDPTAKGRPYRVPKSNPYAGKRRKGAGEIFARGLRNPFRFSFSGARIAIGDVGQERREEVDIERVKRAKGANFGWNVYEGSLRYRSGRISKHTKPVFEYSHDRGCSITGGYISHDRSVRALRGRYVYADFCAGQLRSFQPGRNRGRRDRSTGLKVSNPSSFGVDAKRRLYVASINGGVWRIAPKGGGN
ncbi:MAG: PQQ-dependent sugar dehydrogenase [Solirubrobacterales bacterium]|nr:PQQ-dependent sugar dehydrogenase [Solirubrobacterales bacterium]